MKLTDQDFDFFQKQMSRLLDMPEIKQLDQYVQHGSVTCLEHSVSVTYTSYCMCKYLKMKLDYESLIRGAMLHDYFLYDWHIKDESHRLHGFHHPFTAHKNAEEVFGLNAIESDIILKHMWPLTLLHMPKYKESAMVNIADKLCSLMETFHLPVVRPDFN